MEGHILVVEDEPAIRALLHDTMLDAGFRVTEASNGAKGLEAIAAEMPDLILLDAMMPIMDGFTFLRRMREMPSTHAVPVVMLTARSDDASIDAAFASGVSDFIPKPVNIRVLEHRVRTLVAGRRNKTTLEHMVADRTAQLQQVNAQLRRELVERTRTEAALRASELRFHAAAESSLDAFSILGCVRDARGHIVDFIYEALNARAEQLFRCARTAVQGKSLRETFPVSFTNGSFDTYVHVVETGQPREEVFLEGLPSGAIWLHRQIVPLGDGIVVTTRDITPQKHLEVALQRERDLLHMLLDNIPDAIYFKDTAGRFTRINAAQARVLKVADEQAALGRTDSDFFSPVHAEATQRDEQHLLNTGVPIMDKVEHIGPPSDPFSVSTTKVPVSDQDGHIIGLVGISRNITERTRDELALRVRDLAIAAATDGIIILGPLEEDCPIIYANPAFERLTGYELHEVVNRNVRFLYGPTTDPVAQQVLDTAVREGSSCEAVMLNYRKDGTMFWNAVSLSPVKNEHGRVIHFVGVLRDVSPQKQTEARLRHEALHDGLTGLANRKLFETRLQHVLSDRRQQPIRRFALFFLDLDGFKAVNDELGHMAGDAVLREVGRRMVACVRPQDVVARFGGDEFAILLDHLHDSEDALGLADRLKTHLAQPLVINGQVLTTSVSIGIVVGSTSSSDMEALIRDADSAMYQAKHQGKAGAVLFKCTCTP